MSRRGYTLVATVLFLAACSGEQEAVQESTEESRTVLLSVPSDPTISFSLWFNVGSQNDPPGKEGLAYLTGEMIADASTENHRYEEILEKLYPIASTYEIRVDREMTTLTGRTHRDNTELFFSLFEDAYLRPVFDPDDFQRVKNDAINYLENELRYSSDEELGKAALYDFVFQGTPYAHPSVGTVEGLESITLEDVRAFYEQHYNAANVTPGLGGGFDEALPHALEASVARLPGDQRRSEVEVEAPVLDGREVVLVSKPGADASMSFGFPINVRRGERDFYALWVANSWLGEHRHRASHLFQVIREIRGLNYGNYAYIEVFPEGGGRSMPPVNVGRRHQLFEVWIRTLPNHQAHFALRAAIRELERLVDNGMSEEEFALTRSFLKKYVLHFAVTTSERLGYAIDDQFYGLGEEGHLARFNRILDELTRDEVNAAIRKHLQYKDLRIAIVTGDAEGLSVALASDAASPIEYESEKPQEVLEEDETISRLTLGIAESDIHIVPVDTIFQRGGRP